MLPQYLPSPRSVVQPNIGLVKIGSPHCFSDLEVQPLTGARSILNAAFELNIRVCAEDRVVQSAG